MRNRAATRHRSVDHDRTPAVSPPRARTNCPVQVMSGARSLGHLMRNLMIELAVDS